jgi:MoaA/NifB/PqqE/SkfB family radical SAM enzyme
VHKFRNNLMLIRELFSNLQIALVKPTINWFLAQYMGKFTLVNVGGQLIIHSHLPAVNSRAFTRFIDGHLLGKSDGPSHAQIALTNECPQQCQYCYNKNRAGERMDTDTIKRTVRELKDSGVIWFGFTGGEPLLNKDIVEIVESAGPDCAVKLFTTGCNLTEQLAYDLKKAGLYSVSVSLDHWEEEEHDRTRGCKGAFRAALAAIEVLKKVGGIHVSVSAVLSKDMMRPEKVEAFIRFLMGLEVHEVWLSETKPTVEAFQKKEFVITEEERSSLVRLQDRYNREGKITVNYLGHFEGSEHFGCTAGNKMVYIDAFGEVSPCVFMPMTFGNVKDHSLETILTEMKSVFPTEGEGCCFINKNYELIGKYAKGKSPISREDSLKMMREVQFGPLSRFSRLYYGQGRQKRIGLSSNGRR